MSDYYYSAKNNSFYAFLLKPDYEKSANGWPKDAVQIRDEKYSEITEGINKGKIIIADDNGNPILSDKLPPTQQELIAEAKSHLDILMARANYSMTPLQDALDINIATEEEVSQLKAWKTYRVALNRLDLSAAPDITWPEIPA